MLTIRLDSIRIARFVLRKVESTHRKSICERLRKNKGKNRVVQYTRTESGRQTSTTTRLTGSQVVVLEAEVT